MNTLRYSRTWIALALIAIIGMAAAPAFAWSCCCYAPKIQQPKVQQTAHAQSPETPTAQASSHGQASIHENASANEVKAQPQPSCHQHEGLYEVAAPTEATFEKDTASAKATVAEPQEGSENSASLLSVKPICGCADTTPPPATLSEVALQSHSFAGVALAGPVQAFSLTSPEVSTQRHITQSAQHLRSPFSPALAGRAPPAI